MSRIGFAFDIDGVLIRGKRAIPHAKEALLLLQRANVPFVLLTNGGGNTEADFAENLFKSYGLPVDASQIVLAHTPTKNLVHEYKHKLVCVFGRKNALSAAKAYGFNACTPEQYLSVHHSFPFEHYDEPLGDGIRKMIEEKPVSLAMYYSDPIKWGRDIQLMCDFSMDQMPNGGFPKRNGEKLRTIFCNSDLYWSHSFPIPRLGQVLQIISIFKSLFF